MTLREDILTSPETLSDLAWAAERRFREGEQLLYTGHFAGAVYLLGLSCEIWLKVACFRCRGANAATLVDSQLGPAKLWMKTRASGIHPESYHSLLFWAEYLRQLRSAMGRELPRTSAGQLRHHVVNRLFEDWKIDMRYRLLVIREQQAFRVYNDVVWLRQTWQTLWR